MICNQEGLVCTQLEAMQLMNENKNYVYIDTQHDTQLSGNIKQISELLNAMGYNVLVNIRYNKNLEPYVSTFKDPKHAINTKTVVVNNIDI